MRLLLVQALRKAEEEAGLMSSHMTGHNSRGRSPCCRGGPPHTSRHHGDGSGRRSHLQPTSGHQAGRPGSRTTPPLDGEEGKVTLCWYELCMLLKLTYLCPGSGAGPWCHHPRGGVRGPPCPCKFPRHPIRVEGAGLGSLDLLISEEI